MFPAERRYSPYDIVDEGSNAASAGRAAPVDRGGLGQFGLRIGFHPGGRLRTRRTGTSKGALSRRSQFTERLGGVEIAPPSPAPGCALNSRPRQPEKCSTPRLGMMNANR